MIETLSIESARPLLAALDYGGVAVFAASGALGAARAKHTIVTFAFFAAVTGLGGGTLRDLLIGAPVFWVYRADYLGICMMSAGAVWLVRGDRFRDDALLWLDAVGLAVYAVIGAAKALSYGVPPLGAIAMGVLAASFGGILRDMLAGAPSVLLRREIYVSAAALAAVVYVCLHLLAVDPRIAGLLGAGAGFALRAAALRWNIALPGYRS